ISQGAVGIIFTVSSFFSMPFSLIAKASAARPDLNGLGSLFLNASHNFFSAADSVFSICALLIAGLGFGDGEAVACAAGWAKQTEANASKMPAASRCFFILGSPRVEK